MKFEIKNYLTGTLLFSVETENIKLAIELAIKSGADLYRANLSRANLSGADLYGANLFRADLYGANLSGANGVNKNLITPLRLLLDQPGNIRAYKLVNSSLEGPYNGGIKYLKDKTQKQSNCNTDELEQCGAGINLATLDWCMREWQPTYKILIAEFTAKDIVAIPIATDGKFRVKKCKIVGEKDLKELELEK